jgi:hypothetical protein
MGGATIIASSVQPAELAGGVRGSRLKGSAVPEESLVTTV